MPLFTNNRTIMTFNKERHMSEVNINEQINAYQVIPEALIDQTRQHLSRLIPEQILGIGPFGSQLRGYADMDADKDMTCLVRNSNAHYFNLERIQNGAASDQPLESEVTAINRRISRELGINVSVSLMGEKSLILGFMRGNPSKVSALHSLADKSEYVKNNLLTVFNKYLNPHFLATRAIESANFQINKLFESSEERKFRSERHYLTGLWCLLRALEYHNADVNNDTHVGTVTMAELILNARAQEQLDDDPTLLEPFYRRGERQQGDGADGVSDKEKDVLDKFARKVTQIVATGNKMIPKPSNDAIAKELLIMLNRNAKM